MLEKDPTKRITAHEALIDPWIYKFTTKIEVDLASLHRSLNNMLTFKVNKNYLLHFKISKIGRKETLRSNMDVLC